MIPVLLEEGVGVAIIQVGISLEAVIYGTISDVRFNLL